VNRRSIALVAAALALAACQKKEQAAAAQAGGNDSLPTLVLETSEGRIVLQLDRRKAPLTVDNIVAHVNRHFYDGLIFHRVIKNFVIQTGMLTADGQVQHSTAPPVPNEADNGLKNVRGSVGLARTMDPNSGGVQFYINVADNPPLDFKEKTVAGWGYTVFGHVTEGMDVVDRIAAVPTTMKNGMPDVPVTPVVITRAYLEAPAPSP
jgi:peptidyl-prolyl cis-trans isomerase B (cyclophilin B)